MSSVSVVIRVMNVATAPVRVKVFPGIMVLFIAGMRMDAARGPSVSKVIKPPRSLNAPAVGVAFKPAGRVRGRVTLASVIRLSVRLSISSATASNQVCTSAITVNSATPTNQDTTAVNQSTTVTVNDAAAGTTGNSGSGTPMSILNPVRGIFYIIRAL